MEWMEETDRIFPKQVKRRDQQQLRILLPCHKHHVQIIPKLSLREHATVARGDQSRSNTFALWTVTFMVHVDDVADDVVMTLKHPCLKLIGEFLHELTGPGAAGHESAEAVEDGEVHEDGFEDFAFDGELEFCEG